MSDRYSLRLHNGEVYITDAAGYVLQRTDGPKGFAYGKGWQIVGIAKRFHSRHRVTLAQAADGADIGQGWVHDIDHGTHRMWGGGGRRVRTVTRLHSA